MDKLSEFIPLLIIVVVAIVSSIQSSNKKKEEQEKKKTMLPKGIPTERPSGAPVVSLPKMESVVVTPSVQEKKREMTQSAAIAFNPEVTRSVMSDSEDHILDEVVETRSAILDTANIDELKKAVIYSEILNRKEY